MALRLVGRAQAASPAFQSFPAGALEMAYSVDGAVLHIRNRANRPAAFILLFVDNPSLLNEIYAVARAVRGAKEKP